MTDSMKYLWLLLREDSSYIFMLMLVIVTTVVMSFFLQRLFVSWWGKSIILIMCIVVAITEVFGFLEPESTYKQIQTRKQDVIYTLKTAESPHLKRSRQGFWLKQRCGLARMA
ncbi:hypothetical protein BANRA_05553 [Klebsiella pneumoniae]|nr:hypothetical protein BANRA_05553 [Klebsiella pneumoniae]